MKDTIPGKLIVVEGLDGSGKSTQIHLIARWMEMEGLRVFLTEWNSSILVKEATRKGKKRRLLTPTTFSLIHATDFADRYERQILPLLRAGYIVLADRYIYTAFARDLVRGCSPAWIRSLYGFARKPDLAFYFQTPLETALNRILSARPKLKYHEAGMDLGLSNDPYESFRQFQAMIMDAYEKMAEEFSFKIIDATRPAIQQQKEVRKTIEGCFKLSDYAWYYDKIRIEIEKILR